MVSTEMRAQSDREDTSNGSNKQRHMIEIKDAFVGFKPSPLPPPPGWHYHRLPA